MSTYALPVVLALLISSSAAHGAPDAAPGNQPAVRIPARTSHTVIEGKFARYLESANRDLEGIVLEDGTIVRFAPIKRITKSASLRPGDTVRIEGDVVSGLAGTYLVHAAVTKPGKSALKDTPPSPRGRLKGIAAKIRKTTSGKPTSEANARWSRTQETSAP